MDFGLNDDELDDINEKPISRVKSVEELKSHTIDDNLSDLEKAILLFKSSYEAQLIVGIRLVPNLLRYDKTSCIQKILPILKECCFDNDGEMHRSHEFYETYKSILIDILNNQLLTTKEFTNHFVDLINSKIYNICDSPTDYDNAAICQIFIELMLEIIGLLPENLIKTAIFDTIPYDKLQFLSKRTREYLTILLAKCSTKLSVQIVRQQLFPILLDLCNDTQYEVRASACQSLSVVSRSLGQDTTVNLIIPEMFKYLYDESSLVKTSCFQSLVEILDILDDFETKSYLLKKIQLFVEYGLQSKDELYLIKISEKMGSIVLYLHEIMNNQTINCFIDTFYQICKNEALFSKRSVNESKFNWCTCKINLANCFSDVLIICSSFNYENKLSECLTSLLRDSNEKIRTIMVSKINDIADKIDPSQHHLLINDYFSTLTDQSHIVLSAAINQLEKFLKLFIKPGLNGILNETQQIPGHSVVLKRLLQSEQTLSQSCKYSVHEQLLNSFSLLPWLFCSELLIERVLPVLESRLNARAKPVKLEAAKSLLIILRKIPKKDIRNFYYNKLVDFSVDKNCYKRVIFIEICRLVMQLYSKTFFKIHFYQSLIKLAMDPVVNVRIAFVKIIVDLKKIWKLPNDREKLDQLEVIARNLFRDKDKDVFELAQKAINQMDLIKSYILNENENKFDRTKQEEENYLNSLEPKRPKTKPETSQIGSNYGTKSTSIKSSNGKPSKSANSSFPKNYQSHNSINQNNNQNNSGIDQRLFHQTLNHADHNGDESKKRSQNSLSFSIITDRPKPRPLQTRRNSINSTSELIPNTNNTINSVQSKSFIASKKK